MNYILTTGQMRKADSRAIGEYGIPGIILMENAARSSVEYIDEILCNFINPSVLLICGSGNNGGDGLAIARHMIEKYDIRIFLTGNTEKMSPETAHNYNSLVKLGVDIQKISNEEDVENLNFEADCIIDSMIGVGGSENLRGKVVPILKKISAQNSIKVAVDAPTGLNTDSGIAHPDCFRADHTVTMFAIKTGMLRNDGPDVCGNIHTCYLGAPESIVDDIADNFYLEEEDIHTLMPPRKRKSSKFDYGRIVIVAGSDKYPGAAALCSNAAVKTGAGLVQLYTTRLHPALKPDVICSTVDVTKGGSIAASNKGMLLKALKKANVLLIGPGLSDNNETIGLVKELIENVSDNTSIVIDADGLKAVSKDSRLRENVILTPHTGEFSNLTGLPREEIELNSIETANEWASKLNCNILLKHIPVIITDGKETYWNLNGNPGMASGGTGDVLTGIIGGLVAQGIEPLKAAAYGAYIHAAAGDLYALEHSQLTLNASDIIDNIERII